MKMVLLGRNGSGKTAVIESLLGTSITHGTSSFGWNSIHTVTKQNSQLTIIETPGLFAEEQDIYANKMRLAESVYTFTPGPDAFGLVIRIGRFTPEEKTMIDILREMFGEEVFQFTVLIFTRLDDLKYDGVTLEEYVQESTPELKRVLNACGGRYIGFDNTGTWESRSECGHKLLSMLQDLRTRNSTMVYTVAMLEDATRRQQKKEEEARNELEQSYKEMKEELKSTMRQEMEDEIRRQRRAEQSITAPILALNTQRRDITTGYEPSKPQSKIYTRQKDVTGHTVCKTNSREGAASLKHERGPKPKLKPKPTPPKVQQHISTDTLVQDGAQNEGHTTRVKPKRRGMIGRLIRFWESFHSK
ncbi:GTPase IMAP family member 4-like [Haliotis rubra]|uniref:GTPase IMAP family member 4-like n=1 Tax=Haliotis rubra TaxID=36100 RepID=UPI001EE53FAD|nr:GTPase IMAP family member 4-like [Haliotis rubra]